MVQKGHIDRYGEILGDGCVEILSEMFGFLLTERELGLVSCLGFEFSSADEIGIRIGAGGDDVRGLLDDMAIRCIVFSRGDDDDKKLYRLLLPYPELFRYPMMADGDYEGRKRLLILLSRLFKGCLGEYIFSHPTPPVRVLAREEVLPEVRGDLFPDFRISEIIRSAGLIAMGEFSPIVLSENGLSKDSKEAPKGLYLTFDDDARWTIRAGISREIDRDETQVKISEMIDRGMVPVTEGVREKVGFLFGCNPDHSELIFGVNEIGFKGLKINSGFQVRVNAGRCTGCGICRENCPVRAIRVGNIARLNRERCIGCGICVAGCPSDAMMLVVDRGIHKRLPKDRGELISILRNQETSY